VVLADVTLALLLSAILADIARFERHELRRVGVAVRHALLLVDRAVEPETSAPHVPSQLVSPPPDQEPDRETLSTLRLQPDGLAEAQSAVFRPEPPRLTLASHGPRKPGRWFWVSSLLERPSAQRTVKFVLSAGLPLYSSNRTRTTCFVGQSGPDQLADRDLEGDEGPNA